MDGIDLRAIPPGNHNLSDQRYQKYKRFDGASRDQTSPRCQDAGTMMSIEVPQYG